MKHTPLQSWLLLTLCLACCNLGVMLKTDDPVAKTRTDPISWKAKQEEIKDGVKEAAMPSIEYYKRQKFLFDDPYEKEQERLAPRKLTAPVTEATEAAEDESETGYWWEAEETEPAPEAEDNATSENPESSSSEEALWWGEQDEKSEEEETEDNADSEEEYWGSE